MAEDTIPQWAIERAEAIMFPDGGVFLERSGNVIRQVARYIASKEEAPVDPLEAEAERLRREWLDNSDGALELCLKALKRGMELAGER